MKKKILLGLLLITSVYLTPFLKIPFFQTHDGANQVARIGAYYKAFSDGQFPPRWAGSLNYRFGSPVFIFFYPLSGYIGSFLHWIGLGLEASYKALLAICFLLAPVTFYVWCSKFLKKEAAFFASLLYGLAPYHFLDMYVRGDIGEILGFIFIPLIFYCIDEISENYKIKTIALGGLFYGLLLLSHNGLSLIFTPVFFFYILAFGKNTKVLFYRFAIILLGLISSAYFWVPALLESKYVTGSKFIADMYKENFPTLGQIIFSSWGFGADVGKVGGLSPQLGILNCLAILVILALVIKKKKVEKKIAFWLIIFAVSVFLSIHSSSFLWNKIPLVKLLQFPWRIVGLSSFCAAVLGGYVAENILSKKTTIVSIIILLLFSFQFIRLIPQASKTDQAYFNFTGTTFFREEATPIWTAGDPYAFPKQPIEVIGGNGAISNISRKSQIHTFKTDSSTQLSIIDNTTYFPGWKVFVDSQSVPIEFQDINHRGLITFRVPAGSHEVSVRFEETGIRKVSDILSLCGLLLIVVILAYNRKRRAI